MTILLLLSLSKFAQDQPVLINVTSESIIKESALRHFLPLLFKIALILGHQWHLVVVRLFIVRCLGEAILHLILHDRVVV